MIRVRRSETGLSPPLPIGSTVRFKYMKETESGHLAMEGQGAIETMDESARLTTIRTSKGALVVLPSDAKLFKLVPKASSLRPSVASLLSQMPRARHAAEISVFYGNARQLYVRFRIDGAENATEVDESATAAIARRVLRLLVGAQSALPLREQWITIGGRHALLEGARGDAYKSMVRYERRVGAATNVLIGMDAGRCTAGRDYLRLIEDVDEMTREGMLRYSVIANDSTLVPHGYRRTTVRRWWQRLVLPLPLAPVGPVASFALLTHDNGERPFCVTLSEHPHSTYRGGRFQAYDIPECVARIWRVPYGYQGPQACDEVACSYYTECLQSHRAVRVFDGGTFGNAVLIEVAPPARTVHPCLPEELNSLIVSMNRYYVFVGHEVTSFVTDEEITHFFAPDGGNDVPYPVAVSASRVYFLLDYESGRRSDFLPDGPDWESWCFAHGYSEFYDNTGLASPMGDLRTLCGRLI